LVAQYGHILDQRLEQRAYKIETNTSDTLREIANQLGFLRAGPRDVVDVHTHAIRQRSVSSIRKPSKTWLEKSCTESVLPYAQRGYC